MGWTAPRTWIDEVSDASDFNEQIRDNLLALKSPPTSHYEANELSDYNSTSATYADIDTDWNFTMNTNGGDILIGLIGSAGTAITNALIDVEVDGSRIANNTSGGILQVNLQTQLMHTGFLRWIRGLAAGSHTFKLQWKIVTAGGSNAVNMWAGAGTGSGRDLHPRFWVREVS